MNTGLNVREVALEVLLLVEKGDLLSPLLKNVLEKYDYIRNEEKAFLKALVVGVTERRLTLDFMLDSVSKTPVKKMKPFIRNLLRLGVYQLKYMEHIPKSAAINEAVKLAKKRSFGNLSGFVNGVLRNIDRKDIVLPDDFSVKYSCPEWICELLVSAYGREKTERILTESLKKSRVYLRMVSKETYPEDTADKKAYEKVLSMLSSEGFEYETVEGLLNALCLKNAEGIGKSEAFKTGLVTVQDLSSQLTGMVLRGLLLEQPKTFGDGLLCLDICAAPGGKSLYAAEILSEYGGCVKAFDISDNKVSLIHSAIERLGFKNIEAEVKDATLLNEEYVGKVDIVIADLPCSGLGVFGRKADIKYRLLPEDIEALIMLQRQILKNAAAYLKDGGMMFYSTCTINPAENMQQLEFIKKELHLPPVDISGAVPKILLKPEAKDGCVQLLQGIDNCDGFFLGVVKKAGK